MSHHGWIQRTGDGLLNCSGAICAICAMAMAAGGGEGERMGRWPQQGEPAGEGDVGRSTGGSAFEKPKGVMWEGQQNGNNLPSVCASAYYEVVSKY
jgi:hypothetical protein